MSEIVIDDFSRGVLHYLVTAEIIGFTLNILFLIAVFRRTNLVNANNLPTINVIVAGAAFSASVIWVDGMNMNATQSKVSPLLCQIAGVSTCGSGTVLLVTVAFSAIYRYAVIVLEHKPLGMRGMIYALSGLWITFYSLWLIPALAPVDMVDRFEVSNFGGACMPYFATRKPLAMVVCITTIIGVLGTPINVTFAYIAIWKKLDKVRKGVTNFLTAMSDIRPGLTQQELSAQQLILRHGIVIVGLYAIFWSPLAILWIWECIYGTLAHYYAVGICHILVATHSFTNPLALIYIDRSFRNAMLELFGLKRWQTTSAPVSMIGRKSIVTGTERPIQGPVPDQSLAMSDLE